MVHWYKRDPHAALEGMSELTMEERGAYNSLIDVLYCRGGTVPDDDVLVARLIYCHWREWRALKKRLIAKGKVHILEGGKITANRVQDCLREAARVLVKHSPKGFKALAKNPKNLAITTNLRCQ